MAASTRTLASDPPAPRPTKAGARSEQRRLAITRFSLAGLSLIAVVAFAIYAANMAARIDDVIAPVPIAIPGQGAATPFGIGQYAADFTLTDLEGREVSLSDFAGRPVWVNVWASWCAPCRAEMPDIESVYRENRGTPNGLAILLVSIGEDPRAVRDYLTRTRYDLPVLLDPTFRITERYRISGLPTHYFIDREGIIRDLAIGGLKPNSMRTRVAKIN